MATITGKTKVWMSKYSSVTPRELEAGTAKVEAFFYTNTDMHDSGYTYVGDAELTVTTFEPKTIIANKVEALKEEAKSIRAEAHMKCTRIEEQIQNLLAITYEPTQS
jgi:hypothetical protein